MSENARIGQNQGVRKLRRSLLYVPADNARALEKSKSLDADCVVFDLEDAVAPNEKANAREALRRFFSENPDHHTERAVRINSLSSQWGTEDLMAARACMPDAIVLPKVETPQDVLQVSDALAETDAPPELEIFAMVETARGVLNIAEIAELGHMQTSRLSCLMVGLNDLVLETGVAPEQARRHANHWLMQILLAGRAGGLDIIDSVYNDFRDLEGFANECTQGAAMGFDGKSVIHPSQINPVNQAFLPGEAAVAAAHSVVEAFTLPENLNAGVISLNGKMVERLHLIQAQSLLAKVDMARTNSTDRTQEQDQ